MVYTHIQINTYIYMYITIKNYSLFRISEFLRNSPTNYDNSAYISRSGCNKC